MKAKRHPGSKKASGSAPGDDTTARAKAPPRAEPASVAEAAAPPSARVTPAPVKRARARAERSAPSAGVLVHEASPPETAVVAPNAPPPPRTEPEGAGAPASRTPPLVAPAPATPELRAAAVMAPAPSPIPDFERLARNMALLVEEGGKAASAYLKPRETGVAGKVAGEEAKDVFTTLGQVAGQWFADPARVLRTQAELGTQFVDLWAQTLDRFVGGPAPEPDPKTTPDKRFAAPEWRDLPAFDFIRRAYLMTSDWAGARVDEADLDPDTRQRARFYVRQIAGALSPSNFVATNPELLRQTLDEGGDNLVRGMRMLAEDIEAGRGDVKIRQSDATPFELGVNMATTPGKVVLRNDLIELIQYAPSTPEVFKRPLLIVPPWINKFYVLDLNPEKSFVRWAVAQGLTVFVISWVNPDARHADKDFAAYMREGIFAALDAIERATGEREVTAIGYCVGGTLLAIALALMAARGDGRVGSATFFTAQTDFRDAGDLRVFAGEEQIALLEAQMRETGYLNGAKMANAFNMLRPNELIWSYAVEAYGRGKTPKAFDLLAWNADSTRMPAANHAFYLRNCYLGNKLTRGEMVIEGETLDLGRVTIPVYNLATREDHIAPARSVFTGAKFFGGPMRYVLAGSGHIAGVVNPPSRAKYQYWAGPPVEGTFEDWLASATEHPGTWWPDWLRWIVDQAPAKVPAREPGAGGLPALDDAPGTYVRVQS